MFRTLITMISAVFSIGLLAGCVQGTSAQGDKSARDAAIVDDRYQKPSNAQIKAMLTPLQYDVTQHEGTERPYSNDMWEKRL